ncbi:MAG: hypothetical protein GQ547_08155 [Methylophaga sp.]|nr:hypothetical protein [Methylophaga sp.]
MTTEASDDELWAQVVEELDRERLAQKELDIEALRKQKSKRRKAKKLTLKLFDAGLVQTEYENEARDSRRESFLSAMKEERSRKSLVKVNRETFKRLKALAKKFPNFSHVITRYEDSLRLRKLGGIATVWLPPIVHS